MLKTIRIQNFRSLKDCTIDLNTSPLIFLGANGSGKTTIFEVIKFLYGIRRNLSDMLNNHGEEYTLLSDYLFYKDITLPLRFILTFQVPQEIRKDLIGNKRFKHFQGQSYESETILGSNLFKFLTYEIQIGQKGFRTKLETSDLESDSPVQLLELTGFREWIISAMADSAPATYPNIYLDLEDPKQVTKKGNVSAPIFFDNCEYLWGDPAAAWLAPAIKLMHADFGSLYRVSPTRAFDSSSRITSSDPILKDDLSNIAEVFESINKRDPDFANVIQDEIRAILPDVRSLHSLFNSGDRSGATFKLAYKPKVGKKGVQFDGDQISFGTQCLIGLILRILRCPKESWLCIEEPEISLHPDAQSRLLKLILRESQDRRVWLTTHSTVFAAEAPIECSYLVSKDETGASIITKIKAEDDSIIKVINQLGINPSHLFAARAVILVEGTVDKVFYQRVAKGNGIKDVDFVSTNGWTNIQYFAAARLCLQTRNPIPVFAIVDNDTTSPERKKDRQKLEEWFARNNCSDHLITIPYNGVEGYLIANEALARAFGLDSGEVKKFLDGTKGSPKDNINCFLQQFHQGPLTDEKIEKIASNYLTLPKELESFFAKIKSCIS